MMIGRIVRIPEKIDDSRKQMFSLTFPSPDLRKISLRRRHQRRHRERSGSEQRWRGASEPGRPFPSSTVHHQVPEQFAKQEKHRKGKTIWTRTLTKLIIGRLGRRFRISLCRTFLWSPAAFLTEILYFFLNEWQRKLSHQTFDVLNLTINEL